MKLQHDRVDCILARFLKFEGSQRADRMSIIGFSEPFNLYPFPL